MSDLQQHIAELPPEKRKLLELLLQKQAAQAAQAAPTPAAEPAAAEPAAAAAAEPVPAASDAIPRQAESATAPLSFGQQRLWLVDQVQPGSPFYNIPAAMRLRGNLDVAVLRHSLQEIVRRHAALRTTFATQAGQPVQVVTPTLELELPLMDLSDQPSAEREAQAQQLMRSETQRPFDLARGPLIRVLLLRLDARDHILVITLHHIIGDGWSTSVLLRELAALYPAFAAGQPTPLAELPIQYADYAVWQRARLQGETLERLLAYWRERLGNNPPALELPSDQPRLATHAFTAPAGKLPLRFANLLTQQLLALSKQEGATLFMTLLAAFQVLLFRYSGQPTIVVGSPIANRNRDELEGMIGFFNNMLALRADLSADQPFRALLQQLRETTLGAYEHQDLPFEMLLEELRPAQSPNRAPLFQVMFVLQNMPRPAVEHAGLTLSPMEIDNGTARFDLTLSLRETPQGLAGSLRYNSDLFSEATMSRMLGHYQQLLEAICADPSQAVGRLPLLLTAERRLLLSEWQPPAVQPPAVCLHQLISAQAARTPDAPALALLRTGTLLHLSYAELEQHAARVAAQLLNLKLPPEALVAVDIEPGPDLVVALLGVLKAGAACLLPDPANPSWPQAAGVQLLLCSREREVVPPGLPLLTLDAALAASPSELGEVTVAPEHLASVALLRQPGASPSSVELTHRALVSRVLALGTQLGLAAGDTFLALTPAPSALTPLELLLPLTLGARLAFIASDAANSADGLPGALATLAAQVMLSSPAVLHTLLAAGWPGDPALTVLCDGEQLPPDLAEAIGGRVAKLHALHGTAATGAWALIGDPAAAPALARALPGGRLYLLDAAQQPVPVGIPGTVYLAGDQLVRGYRQHPALTAERFGPTPAGLDIQAAGVLYNTGERARYRPDGRLELLERSATAVQAQPQTAYVAPRTPVEEVLAGIWTAVLGREPIGVYDNFFDLGGHSLNAALLVSRVRETFQVSLALRSLFEATTVAAMAELIIAHEARPGQTLKIAQVLLRLHNSSPEERRRMLEAKRKERQ